MSDAASTSSASNRPLVARSIRKLAIPICLVWLILALAPSAVLPPLEKVGHDHSVAAIPDDAPSVKAMLKVGQAFKEFDSDNIAMLVLDGDQVLGDAAHRYYDHLVRNLRTDPKHIQHVQDFWADRLTAAGVQSADGKAAYAQINLAGNQGEALANEAVKAAQEIVSRTPPPPGLRIYLTGPAALIADGNRSADESLIKITLVTVAVIFVMLFLVYRSISTVLLVLLIVGLELSAARAAISLMAVQGLIGLSVYATTMLTSLVIAAGTDYAIFLLGRYHEARQTGEDLEAAYYTTYRGVAHVVLASGLTVAGATYCLSFTRLPYFRTLGIPSAAGMLIAVLAALTLGPAVLTIAGRFGLLEPKRASDDRAWRKTGAAIARWPVPILTAACMAAVIGLLALPGYKASYNDRLYLPESIPANKGYAVAEQHFSAARLNPDLIMLETDHDMRNPGDMLILDKVANSIFHVPGVAEVQSITRPEGSPLSHSSIAFQIGAQGSLQLQDIEFQKNRVKDLAAQAAEINKTVEAFKQQYSLQQQLTGATHEQTQDFRQTLLTLTDLRDQLADVDDLLRPIRSYYYWERHCYDIPVCSASRAIFDSIDAADRLSEQMGKLEASVEKSDAIGPRLLQLVPGQIATQEALRDMALSNYATMSSILSQTSDALKNSAAMGQAFDASKSGDLFYLPPEAFENKDFQRGLRLFLSPDGRSARMVVTHEDDPATPGGIALVEPMRRAAHEAIKGTSLGGAKLFITGTAAICKDFHDAANYDLLIAGISALCMVFAIMLCVTRSLIAAIVIVGTVALSLGASFGLSVLVWQDVLGVQLHWVVLAMSVIVLLAVGSDYNLLLISRFKQESNAGLNTGIIRSMGATGKVVTAAGLVFAFTMASMAFSDLRIIGQVGTTIGLGLLFDTLVVRSFMTPSIAAILGRWFWWPLRIRQ